MKNLYCESCGDLVKKCDDDAIKVICSTCFMESVNRDFPLKRRDDKTKSGKPQGWHLRKQYVHSDGTVYEFGIEKEELKNTLKPTEIKIEIKKKLTKKELEFNRLDIINDIKKLKKKLKTESTPKKINKINRDISKKQVELSKLK